MSKRVRSREVCADCSAPGNDVKKASFSCLAKGLALTTTQLANLVNANERV